MLRSGSCDIAPCALDRYLSGRVDRLAGALACAAESKTGDHKLEEVARDFASLFYSVLVQQMHKTVRQDDEDGPVAQGVWDFFTMFLPRAIAGQSGDPLTRYIHQGLSTRHGDVFDDSA